MGDFDTFNLNIEQRLATLRFVCNNNTHIELNGELCQKCKSKNCLSFCPANVYNYSETENKIEVDFENCLECGTCRICCPYGAIKWNYPDDGAGVTYKFG